jgi:hypothetical protein
LISIHCLLFILIFFLSDQAGLNTKDLWYLMPNIVESGIKHHKPPKNFSDQAGLSTLRVYMLCLFSFVFDFITSVFALFWLQNNGLVPPWTCSPEKWSWFDTKFTTRRTRVSWECDTLFSKLPRKASRISVSIYRLTLYSITDPQVFY